MISRESIEFLRSRFAVGKTESEIKKELISSGWTNEAIDALMIEFKTSSEVTPVPSPVPPKPLQVGKFKASKMIVSASWNLLKQDKEMLLFPLCSFFATLLVVGLAIFAYIAYGEGIPTENSSTENLPPLWYLMIFCVYILVYFIGVFFEMGLISIADGRIKGLDLTFGDGYKIAVRKMGKIFVWALFASTVGIILGILSDKLKFVGKIIVRMLGATWDLLTYFISPALLLEQGGIRESLKSSAITIKKTWGETVIVNLGVSLYFTILILGGVVLGVIGMFATYTFAPFLSLILLLAVIVYVFLLIFISSALGSIFKLVLYEYASKGVIAPGFSQEIIENSFQKSKK